MISFSKPVTSSILRPLTFFYQLFKNLFCKLADHVIGCFLIRLSYILCFYWSSSPLFPSVSLPIFYFYVMCTLLLPFFHLPRSSLWLPFLSWTSVGRVCGWWIWSDRFLPVLDIYLKYSYFSIIDYVYMKTKTMKWSQVLHVHEKVKGTGSN